jgi:hypothetical protein
MLLENLVIKYKTDEKIIQSLLQFFMISCTSIQNKSIEGKNDPIIELMTPSKINIVH